jgi:hypothetical protein
MTNYKWVINALDCVPKEGQMIDVVLIVHWSRFAIQDNIKVSIIGTMNCEKPNETDFTAYPDLTYGQISQWLENGLNVSEIDKNLDAQIENIKNPPIITLPLPFQNPTN